MQSSENEIRLMRGRLVSLLRAPDTHRIGRISVFFSRDEYPVLTGNSLPDSVQQALMAEFISAGYRVTLQSQANGMTVSLDWTVLNNDPEL
ncbi:hypothetical protein GW742_10065 [Citrobacter freundii]|nr:hypothetical protein [Citrobacter freundii]MBC6506689.1 hypothetical protein [Citrobacter freundii]